MEFKVDAMCDGGDLDCGSGLLLIIKKSMDPLKPGQVLEVRSREKTVAEDLPAWCRMVNHQFLGSQPRENTTSYYIRKGGQEQDDSLKTDLEAARGYQWSVRIQGEEGLAAKIYSRNQTLYSGQPADFSPTVEAPSAIDYLLAALGSDLLVGMKAICSRQNIEIDELELTLKCGLENVLYHLQLEEEGSPALDKVTGTLYLSSPAEDGAIEAAWQTTLERSPLYQTLQKAVPIQIKLQIID